MVVELFIVSAVYWGIILIVFLWLGKRLSEIEKRLNDLKKGEN